MKNQMKINMNENITENTKLNLYENMNINKKDEDNDTPMIDVDNNTNINQPQCLPENANINPIIQPKTDADPDNDIEMKDNDVKLQH